MEVLTTPPATLPVDDATDRRVVYRTRGKLHDSIRRLMRPSDLGQVIKPFVFLDLFKAKSDLVGSMPIHPHSGLATVTVLTEGNVRFDGPATGQGMLEQGGNRHVPAGGGAWHGKEIFRETAGAVQGFQLWLALPPELENGPIDCKYIEAANMPLDGPARVILGSYGSARSPISARSGVTYLLVTLSPGQRWIFAPPFDQTVAWLAIAKGSIATPKIISAEEMVVFSHGSAPITLTASGAEDAVFVIGSAVPPILMTSV